MNQEVATQPTEKSPEILKKRLAYANLGERIHLAEMALQIKSQEALKSIEALPTEISQIADSEKTLKEFKSKRVAIETDRKAITARFKPVVDRLMAYEKSLEQPEQKYVAAILSLKKQHEAEEAKKMQIAEARKNLIEFVERKLAEANHNSYEKINAAVAEVFETAIELDIVPEDIAQFVLEAEDKLQYKDFVVEAPQVNTKLLTAEEANAIILEKWIYNAQGFEAVYHQQLHNKFADYGIAYQNKAVALEQSRKAAEAEEKRLAEEKETAQLAASLAATATPLETDSVGMPVKAIKRSYAIDMLETPDNAISIMAAFVANKKECMTKLTRVTKWFSVTPDQMGKALCELKNQDNNFQPSGIRFKEVEKL